MKFDSWDDFKYFVLGASIASGRSFWAGGTDTNKGFKNKDEVLMVVSADRNTVNIRSTGNDTSSNGMDR